MTVHDAPDDADHAADHPSDTLETPVLLLAMPQVVDPFFQKSVILLLEHDASGSWGFIINRLTNIPVREILEGLELDWHGVRDMLTHFGGPVQPQVGTVLYQRGSAPVVDLADGDGDGATVRFPVALEAVDDEIDDDERPTNGLRDDDLRMADNGAAGDAAAEGAPVEADSLAARSATGSIEIADGMFMTQHLGELARLAEAPPGRFRLLLGYAGWDHGQLVKELMRHDWVAAPVRPELIFGSEPSELWQDAFRSIGMDPASLPTWTPDDNATSAN
ncbi:MAG: YqgE/AlgH family protein [Acidobacteriota bacterium]